MLVSGVQQSDSVIHIHTSILFQVLSPYKLLQEYWVESPVLYSRFLLIIYFIYSSVDAFFKLSKWGAYVCVQIIYN